MRSTKSLKKLMLASEEFHTLVGVENESAIKEEPTHLIRVISSDEQAKLYLNKLNYQCRDDLEPVESLDLMTSSRHYLENPKLVQRNLRRNRVMTLVRNASGLSVAYRGFQKSTSPKSVIKN
jgi:hypothetical protein